MKKKVLAVAVTTLLAAPFAAQSATTLFGHAHASVDLLDNGTNSGTFIASNTSRLGVKGSHKFSDSLKGIYHMEWGVSVDESGASAGDLGLRNRFVGLKGGFGTVVLGRHDTPVKVIGRKVDLFWSTQLGQNRSITQLNGHDARADNVLGYISPNFGPAHVFLAYVPEDSVAPAAQDAFSAALILGGGKAPYFVGLGFDSEVAGDDATRLTGYYKLGAIKLTGFYETSEDNTSAEEQDLFGGGIAFKAGSNTFKGAYYVADDKGNADGTGGTLLSVGIDHSLSKSTAIYANYALLDSDDNATIRLGGAGHGESVTPVNNGEEASGVSLGIRIKF